ncbi:MAG: hypothetical protein JNK45_31085, partial [Myxococcales bacterium]|nr:hypothetical protein [Myxococcales bacterium]
MRFEFSWVVVVMVGLGCGSSTPATDTGGTEGASTTTMTTSSDGEDSSTPITTAESSSSSGGTSTTGTSTGDATTGSTGPGDTTSTGSDGSSSESGSDSGSEGSTTGVVEAPCTAGCMVEFECGAEWKSAEACTTWCDANLIEAAMFSEFCEMAWANLSACFGTLSCDEYAEYVS